MNMVTLVGMVAEAQPAQGAVSPSPEVLRALTDLIKAASQSPGVSGSNTWLTPDGLRAVATFITSISWPLLVFFVVLLFRPQLKDIVRRLTEFEVLGVKAKIQDELSQSAQAAEKSEGLSPAPTPGEIQRAIQVERLTTNADLPLVRQQVGELAAEYERVRGSMRPSDNRTRAMEVVVAKMRTIGRAAYPLRHELSVSPSPGHRLQAIASLQVIPDYDDFLDWLADRIDKERPFVSYHALVALNAAASDERASAHLEALERALTTAKEKSAIFSRDTDRHQRLRQLELQVERLRKAGSPNLTPETAVIGAMA